MRVVFRRQTAPAAQVTPLFVTPLIDRMLSIATPAFLSAMREHVLAMEKSDRGRNVSNFGGWHSSGDFFDQQAEIVQLLATEVLKLAAEMSYLQIRGSFPDCVADVSFIGVGASAGAISAIRSGQIDAIANLDPVISMLEQHNEIKTIADTRTLKDTNDVFGGPMPAATLYAPAAFVQKYPNTTQALTNAMVRALKWIQKAGPSDIIKAVPESYLLGDRSLYIDAFMKVRQAISPDGYFPPGGPDTALRTLKAFEPSLADKQIDLSKTFTNSFVQKANAKYK